MSEILWITICHRQSKTNRYTAYFKNEFENDRRKHLHQTDQQQYYNQYTVKFPAFNKISSTTKSASNDQHCIVILSSRVYPRTSHFTDWAIPALLGVE
jgi:hypothetical protein